MTGFIQRLFRELESARRAAVVGPDAASAAFVLSLVCRRRPGPVLAILPTPAAAERFAADLAYFLGDPSAVELVPRYETLPFEEEPPDHETVASRLAAFLRMAEGREGIRVAPASILAERVIPPDRLLAAAFTITPGVGEGPQVLAAHFEELGYDRVRLVENPGEYTPRGGILDVFSPGWANPLRLDFHGDVLESSRWFHPSDQRRLQESGPVRVLPVTEIVGPAPSEVFKRRLRAMSGGPPGPKSPLARVTDELHDFGPRPWHVTLLPLFYDEPATIFDYCPPGTLTVVVDPSLAFQQARARLEDIRHRAEEEGYGQAFAGAFAEEAALGLKLAENEGRDARVSLRLSPTPLSDPKGTVLTLPVRPAALALAGVPGAGRREGWPAAERIKEWSRGTVTVIVGRTPGSAGRLQAILKDHDIGTRLLEGAAFDPAWLELPPGTILLHAGGVKDGFHLPDEGFTLVTEEDLFGPKRRVEVRRSARTAVFDLDFSTLKPGDFLVHEEHGIGTFGGLARMPVGDREDEMLLIEYAGGGRLYVPMDGLFLVQKYVYAEGHRPKVDRLGGKAWNEAKARAKRAVRTMVRELLQTHARRKAAEGHAFGPDGPWQREFEAAFEYEETPDQRRSIEEVKQDMESMRPMDRLVCGDVGYGKTEVALRAAFKAFSDGRQVCLLAPTTVLCQQHFLTFSRRFAPFPARVEVLSRFTPSGSRAGIMRGLADGTVDVVIGTHSLLEEKVAFANLGLLIVDEEHRFGVKDKERLKRFKEAVDVLTLSATPIPRTFYMALSGLRELSVIETPPENRLAVKTKVVPFSAKVIRESILREMARGGQTFFLHNRVKSIGSMARYLAAAVPEARVTVAHGQMSEKALKAIMAGFIAGESDVLLSTSIVESGLDIPNANTMIINRADRFGLADLYQLRGRIGRSSHQAFAYLVVPAGVLTQTARQRLSAIEEFSELGSGVRIAALDLEIRGAGNILGYEQSGQMAEVGLEMYTRLLEEASAEARGEVPPSRAAGQPEISSPFPTFIPESYLPDVNQRLTVYKRLSLIDGEAELWRYAGELEDLFGRPPAPVRNLLGTCALRLAARRAGVRKVVFPAGYVQLDFSQATAVDPARLIDFLQRSGGAARMKGPERLLLALPGQDPSRVLPWVKKVLLELADYGSVGNIVNAPPTSSAGPA